MKSNMGSADKAIRIIVALVIGVLAYLEVISGVVAIVLIALAAIFVLTSMISFCPLYWPFKLSTKKKE